jgi:ribosomal protein L12E/L44/L45/RPP1/RPP2
MELILAKAASNAKAIASLTSGEMAPSAAAGAAAPVEEEEEKKDEGDAAAGLGALFG